MWAMKCIQRVKRALMHLRINFVRGHRKRNAYTDVGKCFNSASNQTSIVELGSEKYAKGRKEF